MYAFYRSRIGQPRAISSPSLEPSMKRDHSPSRQRLDPGNRRPDLLLFLLTPAYSLTPGQASRSALVSRFFFAFLFVTMALERGLMDSRHKPRGSSHRPQIPLRLCLLFTPDFFPSQRANPALLSTSQTLNEPGQKSFFQFHLSTIYAISSTTPCHPVYQHLPCNPRLLHLSILQMDLCSTFRPTTWP